MKLNTDITPRGDGTVTAVVPATEDVPGAKYLFRADECGTLVAVVEHEAHIGYLLDTGNFYPAEESDIDAGMDAIKKAEAEAAAKAEKEKAAAEKAAAKAEKAAAKAAGEK